MKLRSLLAIPYLVGNLALVKFNLTVPYFTQGPDRNVPLRKSGGRARGSPERMTTLARPSVSLGTFVCYGCRLPRLDSVPRMSEGRSNRSEGQSKCQRPQGFWGFHFGPTFRFHSIPSVNPPASASTITIPPSQRPPGPYYFHHISRLQKFSLPSLPYLSAERASERACHAVRHLGTITVREVPPLSLWILPLPT